MDGCRYGGVGKLYVCPQCKKEFQVPFQTKGGGKCEWAYRCWKGKKRIYFCSYSCFRKNNQMLEDEKHVL